MSPRLLLVVLVPLALTAAPDGPPAGSAVAELVAAERAFAQAAAEKGVSPAFLEVLTEDALIFQPGPTNGRRFHRETPFPAGVRLAWEPAFAEASAAGDLGYTTGPFVFTVRGGSQVVHGTYVTIWRREPGQPWRLMADLGVAHARPDGPTPTLTWHAAPATKPDADRPAAAEAVRTAERGFTGDLAAADLRQLRKGAVPTVGAAAAQAADPAPRWEPAAVHVSRSGDLAWTHGTATLSAGASAHYAHVWRKEAGGWRLALDVSLPAAAK